MFGKHPQQVENHNEVQDPSVTDPVPGETSARPEPMAAIPQTAAGPVPAPRKRRTGIFLSLLLLAVLLAAGAGYLLNESRTTSDEPTLPSSSQANQRAAQPVGVTMRSATIIDAVTKTVGGQTAASQSYGTPVPYRQVSGYAYSTMPSADNAVHFVRTSADYEATYRKAEQALLAESLKSALAPARLTSADSAATPVKWFNDNTVWCQLQAFAAQDHIVTVACANDVTYQAVARDQQPLYEAYLKGATNPLKDNTLLMQKPTMRQSPQAGYQTAEVGTSATNEGVGGYAAVYYQTPDKVWHWFGGTQQLFMCSDFKTTEQRKAFLGSECTADASTGATGKVQL